MILRNRNVLKIIRHDYPVRLVLAVIDCINYHLAYICRVNHCLRLIVLHEQRQFTVGKLVVCKQSNRADFAWSNVCCTELRAVCHNSHNHIVLAYSVLSQCMSKFVCLHIELSVSPRSPRLRIDDGSLAPIPSNISHETVEPCIFVLKSLPKHSVIISSLHFFTLLFIYADQRCHRCVQRFCEVFDSVLRHIVLAGLNSAYCRP